jgi:isochorismate pyruvate lyase
MTDRVFSGAPWEKLVGYCRAIRRGPSVYVSGTAPVDDHGDTYAPGDAYAQARRCLELIERALAGFALDRRSIVRTRMFVTDITRWADFGRAHAEFFGEDVPATSMVEIRRLIAPEMLIEIEADATSTGSATRS